MEVLIDGQGMEGKWEILESEKHNKSQGTR